MGEWLEPDLCATDPLTAREDDAAGAIQRIRLQFEAEQALASDAEEPKAAAKPKSKSKKRKPAAEANPVHQVLFSNFIIQ